MSKREPLKRKRPSDPPDLNSQQLLVLRLVRSGLTIEQLNTVSELQRRAFEFGRVYEQGLIEGLPSRFWSLTTLLNKVGPHLTGQQIKLLRWIWKQPRRAAHLGDVAKYRMGMSREMTPADWQTQRVFCGELRTKLSELNVGVRLEIEDNHVAIKTT